jgi:hypothetical protein
MTRAFDVRDQEILALHAKLGKDASRKASRRPKQQPHLHVDLVRDLRGSSSVALGAC